MDGEVYRHIANRRTFRVESGGRGYFVKIHNGVGYWEILKNLLQFKIPVVSASNEWRAALKLRDLGIATIVPVAYACKGWNPAKLQSCIVTQELAGMRSLEEVFQQGVDPVRKRRLIQKVARSAKTLHANGMNHRDC